MIIELSEGHPQIASDCFLAPSADLIGDVKLGSQSSVWFRAVIRGDVMPIRIGKRTNIQDGCIVHGTYQKCGAVLGDEVSVGHGVILHGCNVSDRVLVGMGAMVMDQAKIASDSIVAAGSLVTEGKEFPPGVLIVGRPARVKRELDSTERSFLKRSADNYVRYSQWYKGRIKQGEDDGVRS